MNAVVSVSLKTTPEHLFPKSKKSELFLCGSSTSGIESVLLLVSVLLADRGPGMEPWVEGVAAAAACPAFWENRMQRRRCASSMLASGMVVGTAQSLICPSSSTTAHTPSSSSLFSAATFANVPCTFPSLFPSPLPFPFGPWPSFPPPFAQQSALKCPRFLQLWHSLSFFPPLPPPLPSPA
ncbi:hypothetical protein B0H34DRAFT_154001 [Crassisporium funariophilum]|nr:hypothetical protein B0H34DRAFT_154001 [Crassisporium funariophilum]